MKSTRSKERRVSFDHDRRTFGAVADGVALQSKKKRKMVSKDFEGGDGREETHSSTTLQARSRASPRIERILSHGDLALPP